MRHLFTILTLSFTLTVFTQNNAKKEKIDALEIAYITEHLDFTKKEAQDFWPIYNIFEDTEDELRNKIRAKKRETNLQSLTETEAKKLLTEFNNLEKQMFELHYNYDKDLLKILPAKKILLLKKTEEDFRRKIFEEYKKHRNPK
ncbi:MAG: sensor of ECF-type sigma factor [Aestuariibaculum sp.]